MARAACTLLALLALAAPGMAAGAAAPDDAEIRKLNDAYVWSFLACDVARFQTLLADDFSGVLADGRVIDKAEFLREAASAPDARGLQLHDVVVSEYGDAALVGALVTYTRAAGTAVRTRYSAVYVRREGSWAIVRVQWTRVTAP